ncbi:hypothetical protein ACJIZ3_013681 [Penstemon smallii]|uniref:Uncharacterized protein n=1 Tax=Penstemon smallii TaxID=265156 RepID=A0ABD3RHQ2_9LAMI
MNNLTSCDMKIDILLLCEK